MVPKKGLEPPRPCGHMDLNHARLPVPPLRQLRQLACGAYREPQLWKELLLDFTRGERHGQTCAGVLSFRKIRLDPLCAHTARRPQRCRPVASRDSLGPPINFNALRVCPQAPRDMRQTQSALQNAAPVLSVLRAVGRRSRLRYCFSGGAGGGNSGRSIKGITEPSTALIKR